MGMIGVTFGNQHSYDDWHVYLNGFEVDYPTPRRVTIDVALRNGLLDVTSALTGGKIFYETRKIKIDFEVIDNPLPWQALHSKIARAVHGKSLPIIYDMDPSFYWDAYNCVITTPSPKEDVESFSIECDCNPYKHEIELYSQTFTLGSYPITKVVENLREEVVPIISTTYPVVLTYNGTSYTLSPGDNYIETIELGEGLNYLRFDPIVADLSDIAITFRRGEL